MELVNVLAWLVVGIGCGIGYQLVRQNGRILLHLELLEQQITELKLRSAPAVPAAPAVAAGLPVGIPAPRFDLPDLAGHTHTLDEWHGRALVLIFFNPDCGFCQQLAPEIASFPVDDKNMPMPLLISTGRVDANRKLIEEHGLRCPLLLQKQMEVASQFRVSGTPIGYLIDEQGNIASDMATGGTALLQLASRPIAARDHPREVKSGKVGSHIGHELTNSKIERHGLPAGTAAPAFRLPRLEQGEIALEDFRGRRVLLIFTDPGCGPCQQVLSKLPQVSSEQSDIQVLIISRGSREANQAKAEEHKLMFPIVLQKHWEISRLYATFATPAGYLIDEQGVIVGGVAIGVDEILALLSGASSPASDVIARTG